MDYLTYRDGGRGYQPSFDEQQDIKAGRYPGEDAREWIVDFIAAACILAFGVMAGGML